MPKRESHKVGSELFIVDNSAVDWKALRYLHDWCQLSKSIDIATGYFEIGALLSLDGEWQKVEKIRILMGDEVSKRTKKAFEKGLKEITAILDGSIEKEKTKNHFLSGVPAIVEAIRNGKIECRVYRKGKFHAKAYITHARMDVIGSAALVGSSNFTFPGLTENIELNVQITGAPVAVLQEWYEEHWEEAEDVSADLLKVIERHVHEYVPFDVYARSLQQYFLGHEESASEPAFGWVKKGTNPTLKTTSGRARVNIHGALNLETFDTPTLIQSASRKWLRLKGRNHLPKVIEGIIFNDGIEVMDDTENRAA